MLRAGRTPRRADARGKVTGLSRVETRVRADCGHLSTGYSLDNSLEVEVERRLERRDTDSGTRHLACHGHMARDGVQSPPAPRPSAHPSCDAHAPLRVLHSCSWHGDIGVGDMRDGRGVAQP